jgi:hypothetical protein
MRRRSPLAIGWVLAVIAGATAVGITTQRPGFVVITFIGGLWLPRLLGFGWGGHHHRHGGGPWHGCHGGEAGVPRSEETVTA